MKHIKELSVYNHNIYQLDKPIKGFYFIKMNCEDCWLVADCELGEIKDNKFCSSGFHILISLKEDFTEEVIHSAKVYDKYTLFT